MLNCGCTYEDTTGIALYVCMNHRSVDAGSTPVTESIKKRRKTMQWRNETDEQKAFGYGVIFGFLAAILGMLVGMWTHG